MIEELVRNGRRYTVDTSTYRPQWWKEWGVTWEIDTALAIDKHVTKDTLFVDIGAWIGPFTLYAGQIAKSVVSFEPDPRAFANLARNVGLNESLRERSYLYNLALWSSTGVLTITGSGLGNAQSSLVHSDPDFKKYGAQVVTFDAREMLFAVCRGEPSVFCKMDVEGAEYEIIPHARDFFEEVKPTTIVSFHPNLLDKAEFDKGNYTVPREKTARLLQALSFYPKAYFYQNGDWTLTDATRFLADQFDNGTPFRGSLVFSMS